MGEEGAPVLADPAGRRRSGGTTRGFLFADLRGYTAFLEQRGANVAAELLDRYRALVRSAVAEHDGAEIRTEGDSFYVVFPDASAAVACGLTIIRAAAVETKARPDLPIHVGVGVHAGETVETTEGYVGSAVNIAARLCALAVPGEVLVSDTVRALTSGVAPVRYEPRGRRRLKGVADAMITYRAVPRDAPIVAPRWSERVRARPVVALALVLFAAGAALVVVAAGGFLAPVQPAQSPGVSPVDTAAPGAAATNATAAAATDEAVTMIELPPRDPETELEPVALERGLHRFEQLTPTVTFDVPDDGWYAYRDYVDAAGLLVAEELSEGPPEEGGLLHDIGGVDFGRVQVVHTEPCRGSDTRLLESSPNALVEWLQNNELLDTSTALPVNLGGYSGLQVDVSLATETDPCPEDGPAPAAMLFPLGEDLYFVLPGERIRVITLDVAGRPFSLLVWGNDQYASFDTFIERATPLLESLRITP